MDEKFVICPFNKSHVINRLRIQYHLVKCRKNFPNCKKIICPYNATEYIDPDNFLQHLSQCKKSKGLDVTEGYKRKQFESSQHGCVNDQTFQMPSHVEITDEWDIASSDSSNSCDRTITRDERNAFRLRRQSSDAIKKSYSYIPFVPNSIGRGQVNGAIRQYLNQYEPPVKPLDKTAPICLADNNDHGIYDDCDNAGNNDNSNYNNVDNEKQEKFVSCDSNMDNRDDNLTDDNDNETVASNCSSKYYIPSVGRGSSSIMRSRGRGITVGSIGRGITFNSNSTISSASESFDHVLRQVVDTLFHKELLANNKENTLSEYVTGEKRDIVDDNLRTENEKKFALMPSDILSGNSKSPQLATKELMSEQTDSQPIASSVLSPTKFVLNSKDNNNRAYDSEVLSCSIDSLSNECKAIMKEESTKDSKPDDLKNRLDETSDISSLQPHIVSFGRGQLLRSPNNY